MFIGAYAIIDGALKLFSGLGDHPDQQSRWPALILGALSIIAGLIIVARPIFAVGVLTYIIALWAIAVGILVLVWALRLQQELQNEWLLLVFGVISMIFGLVVLANISDGILALRSVFIIYMIVGGILAIALALRIKSLGERLVLTR